MLRFLLRRLVMLVAVLVAVSVLTFAIVNVLPGDVATAILGDQASPDQVTALRAKLGLDRPVTERYLAWISGAVQGDFGTSLSFDQPIGPVVLKRLENSGILAGIAMIIVVPTSVLLGTICAVFEGRVLDRAITSVAVFGFALPEFVTGIALIFLFSILFPILPGSSLIEDNASPLSAPLMLVLPVLVLMIQHLAHLSQVTRTSMARVMTSHYVRTAALKGLPLRTIVLKHGLPNALAPVIAEIGMNFGYMLGGLVVVESLFSYAGIGQLIVMSVQNRDIPTLQATVLLIAAAYGGGNLVADIAILAINPRLRG